MKGIRIEGEKVTVDAVCEDCSGTGVYSGMCEGPGRAVVCLGCGGSGCKEVRLKLFTERRVRRDIKTVGVSRGRFIVTGVGKHSKSNEIPYADFLKGKKPRIVEG